MTVVGMIVEGDGNRQIYLGLEAYRADCPWCGEALEWVLDSTADSCYVEDCYVCCRPCLVRPLCDADGCIYGLTVDCE